MNILRVRFGVLLWAWALGLGCMGVALVVPAAQADSVSTSACDSELASLEQLARRNPERAGEPVRDLLERMRAIGAERCVVGALLLQARVQRYLGQLTAATASLREAIIRASDGRMSDLRALAQARLGQALEAMGDLAQATALLTEAVQGAGTDPDIRGHALNLLGHVYQVAGRLAESEQVLREALQVYQDHGLDHRTASVLMNLAVTLLQRGQTAESARLTEQALLKFTQQDDPRGAADALTHLGTLRLQRGDTPAALDALREALVVRERLKDRLGTATAQTDVAEVLLTIAELTTDPPEAQRLRLEALGLLEAAERFKETERSRATLRKTLELLERAHQALGHPQAAADSLRRLLAMERTIHSEESTARFAELAQRYELDRKADELARAKLVAEAAEQRVTSRGHLIVALILALTLVLGGAAVSVVLLRTRQRARDATDARRASEQLLLAAIGATPIGITVIRRDDRILHINRAALDIFGRNHDEPTQWIERPAADLRDFHALTDLDNRPWTPGELPVATVLRTGQSFDQRECCVLDGREGRRILISALPVQDASGELIAVAVATVDITELRMIEAQREQLRSRLAAAERSEAIHLALGGLAHEFSNQLGVAVGYAELLPGDDTEVVDELRTALERSSDLVRQLQLLAGFALPHAEQLNPAELVEQVAEAFAVVQPHAPLEIQQEGRLPPLAGDAKLLRHALSELLLNAVGAGPHGSPIQLQTWVTDVLLDLRGSAVLRPQPASRYIVFAVQDDGIGMNEGVRKRAFDPYFSGRPQGRGMGLSLVAGIVRAHHGGIYLDSRVRGGTWVALVLPVQALPLTVRTGEGRVVAP